MNPRRLIPGRLRHHTRITAIQCRLCGLWVNPRHLRVPACVCRDCETTAGFQTWKPTTPAPAVRTGRQLLPGGTR
jgi:hypothetical protein